MPTWKKPLCMSCRGNGIFLDGDSRDKSVFKNNIVKNEYRK